MSDKSLHETMKDTAQMLIDTLEQHGPRASEAFLREHADNPQLALPEVMLKALRGLPPVGRMRRKTDRHTVQSVSMLLPTLPEDEPLRPEIARLYAEVAKRTPKSNLLGEALAEMKKR